MNQSNKLLYHNKKYPRFNKVSMKSKKTNPSNGWAGQLSHWNKYGRYGEFCSINILTSLFYDQPFKNMLDVGCGNGALLSYFKDLNVNTIGVDNSKAIIEFHSNKTKLQVVRSDARDLPFRNSQFDMVLCLGLVEHFKNPKLVLRELGRVSKPGARILITVPNRLSVFPLLAVIWYLRNGMYHYSWLDMVGRTFTKRTFRELLNASGLEVSRIGSHRASSLLDWAYIPYKKSIALRIESSRIIQKYFGFMLYAVCYPR